ncbi:hypothetical protein [Roseomonas chloroacetimidivorans]|jgi:hypothetical protein|uniref:hypothetical protein n=1 Tax=Roseomonas chloroacetimidivorans TaxID=1766656 RepID=UPI003C786520
MEVFGLGPGAQIIILQALATYSALGSAYLLLRPVLRGHLVQSHRDVLASLAAPDADTRELLAKAGDVLAKKAQLDQPKARRENRWGHALLILSVLLFSAALALQISTDAAFRRSAADTSTQTPSATSAPEPPKPGG